MLQEERPQPSQQRAGRATGTNYVVPSGSRTTASSVMSETVGSRRAMLGQSYYQDAKEYISRALSADEKEERMLALELYNKSLSTIRSGLAVLLSSVGDEAAMGSSVHEIRGKMERMKEQIKDRMEVLLQYEIESRTLAKSTTSGTAATVGLRSTANSTTGQVSTTTSRTRSAGSGAREAAKADVLFNVDTGIGLFEVDQKDHVRKYDDVDALTVFKYRSEIEGQPPAFLQCGGFVYPLIPGKSPILKSGDKMYMFPELKGEDGNSVGVSLGSTSAAEIAQLDQLLSQLALLKTVEEVGGMVGDKEGQRGGSSSVALRGEETWGSSVAGNIDKGVSWVSTKIAQGTEVAGNLIIKGANKLRDQIEPNEKPTEIPVSVQKGAHYTRKASECVVGVSDFFMTSLAKLTIKVGRGVKDMVQETEYVKNTEVNPQVKEAWKVTKSGLKGAAEVFTDLKNGAVAVAKATGNETSQTVGHKYGDQAEKVADDSLSAAGNTAVVVATYWSWKTWGITLLGKVGEVVTKKSREEGVATAKVDK